MHQAQIGAETVWELVTDYGASVVTGGHRIYTSPTEAVEAKDLQAGAYVLAVVGGQIAYSRVRGLHPLPPRDVMYDITVEGNHNLVLSKSSITGHNCPDRDYHFAPPEAEGNIGAYNRVFGQIWREDELFCYLERGLDWFNMMPPMTEGLDTIDKLVMEKPAWRTAILWEAISHACFALAAMMVHEEFDYSIGGISLSIERSSKYESLKQNAESQFDKAAEAKARTVKFLRGISQPKYGIGIKSAFGSSVGRGVLSPRNFL